MRVGFSCFAFIAASVLILLGTAPKVESEVVLVGQGLAGAER